MHKITEKDLTKLQIAIILYLDPKKLIWEGNILDDIEGSSVDQLYAQNNVKNKTILFLGQFDNIESNHKKSSSVKWGYTWRLTLTGQDLRKQLVKDGWYLADA